MNAGESKCKVKIKYEYECWGIMPRNHSVTSGTGTGMNAGEFEMLCQYRVQELKCYTNIKYKSYTTREYRAWCQHQVRVMVCVYIHHVGSQVHQWVVVASECMSDLRTIPSKRVWCLPSEKSRMQVLSVTSKFPRFVTHTANWSTKGFHMSKSVSAWRGKIRESRQVTSMNVLIISPILLA